MQKKLLILGTLTLLVLSACQNIEETNPKNAAEEELRDKAVSTSLVTITIPGEESTEKAPEETVATIEMPDLELNNKQRRMLISEEGLSPNSMNAKAGDTLVIHNSLDHQIDLYTTAAGADPCPILDATIEIPGLETREIILPDSASCDIINQLNTDQKTTLTVE